MNLAGFCRSSPSDASICTRFPGADGCVFAPPFAFPPAGGLKRLLRMQRLSDPLESSVPELFLIQTEQA